MTKRFSGDASWEYCAVIITPDAVRRQQSHLIIQRLLRNNMEATIIAEKSLIIDRWAIESMYHKLATWDFRQAILNNYLSGPSLAIAMRGSAGLNERVNFLKGRFNPSSGLRQELGACIIREVSAAAERHEFRLHSSDTSIEALRICAWLGVSLI